MFGGQYQDRSPGSGPKKIPSSCAHANQEYRRLPDKLPRGSGQWVCAACGAARSPALEQEGVVYGWKDQEVKRLHFLRYYFSDAGPHGSFLRYQRFVGAACIWPRTCYDDPWLDSSSD